MPISGSTTYSCTADGEPIALTVSDNTRIIRIRSTNGSSRIGRVTLNGARSGSTTFDLLIAREVEEFSEFDMATPLTSAGTHWGGLTGSESVLAKVRLAAAVSGNIPGTVEPPPNETDIGNVTCGTIVRLQVGTSSANGKIGGEVTTMGPISEPTSNVAIGMVQVNELSETGVIRAGTGGVILRVQCGLPAAPGGGWLAGTIDARQGTIHFIDVYGPIGTSAHLATIEAFYGIRSIITHPDEDDQPTPVWADIDASTADSTVDFLARCVAVIIPVLFTRAMALLTHDDFSLQCSMLREKRIREFKTWDAEGFAPGTGGPHHAKLTTSWHQVWDPFIHSLTLLRGSVTSPDSEVERIDDTIPRLSSENLVPHTLDILSETITCSTCQPSSTHTVASFIAEFHGMGSGLNHGLRMRLENRVRNPMMEEDDRSFLPVGQIAFWHWASEDRVCMPISASQSMYHAAQPDDDGVTNGKNYRYWAPEDGPAGSKWYGTERDFRWPADTAAGLVSSTGIVKMRLTLKHPGQFTVKWDLVQLAWTNDSGGSVSEEEEPGEAAIAMQGANVNHDGTVDENDIVTFVDAYMDGANAADFDQDGDVNSADVLTFFESFAEGGTP